MTDEPPDPRSKPDRRPTAAEPRSTTHARAQAKNPSKRQPPKATVTAELNSSAAISQAQGGKQVTLDELFPMYASAAFEEKTKVRRAQLIAELRKTYLGEGLALYIGAGVSMSVGLPSWNELIHSLTVSMMSQTVTTAAEALQELTAEQRAEALKALLEEIKNQKAAQKPVLMMARALKDQFREELPTQVATHLYGRLNLGTGLISRLLRRLLGQAVGSTVGDDELQLPTSPLMDALVHLIRPQRNVAGVHALINYNYDDILEERLRKDSVPCLTVLSGKQKLTRGKVPSYHVHGVLPIRQYVQSIDRTKRIDNGNFVFSEDEYHSEYADPYRWSNLTQIGILSRHKGLFVGLSMQDPNLRRLIDVTHRQYPEIWNYTILQRAPRLPDDDAKSTILKNLAEYVEEDSFLKIGVKVLWVNDIRTDVAPLLTQIAELPEE